MPTMTTLAVLAGSILVSPPAQGDTLTDGVVQVINGLRATGATCVNEPGSPSYPPSGALSVDPLVTQAASGHALYMMSNGTMTHVQVPGSSGFTGEQVTDRLSATGYNWATAGENVAYGYPTAQEVVQGWLTSSQGHCSNMLDPKFVHAGVGHVVGTTDWWALNLAVPKPIADQAQFESALLNLVNQKRASGATCGAEGMPSVPPLVLHPLTTQIAQAVAEEDLANPTYSTIPSTTLQAQNVYTPSQGMTYGPPEPSPQQQFEEWMANEGICRTLMSRTFVQFGLGYPSAGKSHVVIYMLDIAGTVNEVDRHSIQLPPPPSGYMGQWPVFIVVETARAPRQTAWIPSVNDPGAGVQQRTLHVEIWNVVTQTWQRVGPDVELRDLLVLPPLTDAQIDANGWVRLRSVITSLDGVSGQNILSNPTILAFSNSPTAREILPPVYTPIPTNAGGAGGTYIPPATGSGPSAGTVVPAPAQPAPANLIPVIVTGSKATGSLDPRLKRKVRLQKQISPTKWKTMKTRYTSARTGRVTFKGLKKRTTYRLYAPIKATGTGTTKTTYLPRYSSSFTR